VITFPSICDLLQCCKDCGKHIRGVKAIKEHKCHHFMCRTSQKVVPQKDHKCYMQLLDPKKEVVLKNEQEDSVHEEEEGEELGYSDDEDEEKEEREKPVTKFVFYDFVAMQDRTSGSNDHGKVFTHEPNLCIEHVFCELCMDLPLGNCQNCGPNKRTFAGDDAAAKFCDFLFDMKHVVALAHNSQGYDGHFIMQYLHKQDMPLKIITRRLKTI